MALLDQFTSGVVTDLALHLNLVAGFKAVLEFIAVHFSMLDPLAGLYSLD